MNFGALFKAKNKVAPTNSNKKENIGLMIDQKIKEYELKMNNNQEIINALTEETKNKLKSGDKISAKRLLFKIKVFKISQKIWNETYNKLEEIQIKLGMSDSYSDEDLNEFEQSYYSIIKNSNEKIKNTTIDGNEIDDNLNELEGNKIDNYDMKFTEMESDNYMKNKIIELEKRIIVLENKIQQLEGKNQISKENNKNNNANVPENEIDSLNEFLAT